MQTLNRVSTYKQRTIVEKKYISCSKLKVTVQVKHTTKTKLWMKLNYRRGIEMRVGNVLRQLKYDKKSEGKRQMEKKLKKQCNLYGNVLQDKIWERQIIKIMVKMKRSTRSWDEWNESKLLHLGYK